MPSGWDYKSRKSLLNNKSAGAGLKVVFGGICQSERFVFRAPCAVLSCAYLS